MPRRGRVVKRTPLPDSVYHSLTMARLINRVMKNGKKSTAETVVYDAIKLVGDQVKDTQSVEVMEQAIKRVTPLIQVKSRRIGGATYQVPTEVSSDKGMSLALRWLVEAAKERGGRSMAEKLAAEMVDAFKGQGAAAKKREEVHKMAEANRAFAHYRW
jgi:small subunit ribosomal protein S7